MNDNRESSHNGPGGEAPRKRPAVDDDDEGHNKKPKEEYQGIIPKDQGIILPPFAAIAVPQWKRDMDKERDELDKWFDERNKKHFEWLDEKLKTLVKRENELRKWKYTLEREQDALVDLRPRQEKVAAREKEVKDRQAHLQKGEKEVEAQRKEIKETQLQLQRKEKEAADRQARREKAIEAREKEVAAREKAVRDGQALGGALMQRDETSDDEGSKDIATGSCVLVDIPIVDDPSSADDYEAFEGVIMKRKWEVCFEDGERRDYDDDDMKACIHDFKEHCLKGHTNQSQQQYVQKLKATVEEKYNQEQTNTDLVDASETGNGENEDDKAFEEREGKKYFTCPPSFRVGDIVQAIRKDSGLRYKLPGDNDWRYTTVKHLPNVIRMDDLLANDPRFTTAQYREFAGHRNGEQLVESLIDVIEAGRDPQYWQLLTKAACPVTEFDKKDVKSWLRNRLRRQ